MIRMISYIWSMKRKRIKKRKMRRKNEQSITTVLVIFCQVMAAPLIQYQKAMKITQKSIIFSTLPQR